VSPWLLGVRATAGSELLAPHAAPCHSQHGPLCYVMSAQDATVLALVMASCGQGLTLVHFTAQLERFVWDEGCA